jgi:hypothetical protein
MIGFGNPEMKRKYGKLEKKAGKSVKKNPMTTIGWFIMAGRV